MTAYDVIIVGCGGWGLAILKVLKELGLHVLGRHALRGVPGSRYGQPPSFEHHPRHHPRRR